MLQRLERLKLRSRVELPSAHYALFGISMIIVCQHGEHFLILKKFRALKKQGIRIFTSYETNQPDLGHPVTLPDDCAETFCSSFRDIVSRRLQFNILVPSYATYDGFSML